MMNNNKSAVALLAIASKALIVQTFFSCSVSFFVGRLLKKKKFKLVSADLMGGWMCLQRNGAFAAASKCDLFSSGNFSWPLVRLIFVRAYVALCRRSSQYISEKFTLSSVGYWLSTYYDGFGGWSSLNVICCARTFTSNLCVLWAWTHLACTCRLSY